jgi:hypothetical protein
VKREWILAKTIAVTMAILIPGMARAGMVLTPPAAVLQVETYTDFNNGDVIFKVNTPVAGCIGFWITPADGGYKMAVATLMMAKASQIRVIVYAYDNLLWPGGNPASYCKVRSITAE